MCKIMGISNLTKIPHADLDKHLLKLRDIVCVANNDGFGYALSYQDEVFSEKFTRPNDFKGMLKSTLHEKLNFDLFNVFEDSLAQGKYYENVMPKAVVAHGRTSTNTKGLPEYSHPFFDQKTKSAFVHNGVVDVTYPMLYNLETANDSEYLANVFWHEGLNGLAEISGYFAFMNLKENGLIELVKDDRASLHAAFSADLDGYIFATIPFMIESYAREFKISISNVVPVMDNMSAKIMGSKIFDQERLPDREHAAMVLSYQQRQAFKDYGRDVKELDEPKVIKGAHVGAGKSTPQAASTRGGKNISKKEKKRIKKIVDQDSDLSFKASTGKPMQAWMSTQGLTDAELSELEKFENELFEKWRKEETKEKEPAQCSLEDRAFPKKMFSQDELQELIRNEADNSPLHDVSDDAFMRYHY